jgi:hypothetical protein
MVALKNRVKTKQYALLISSRVVTRGDSIFPFGTLAIRIAHIDGDKLSAPIDSAFNGLVLACEWNENNPHELTRSWKAYYREMWKVEHADAERMVKMLRKLRRIRSSASVRSFGNYVAVIAKALKINLALKESMHLTGVPSYNFNEYVHVKTSSIAKAIDEIVDQVRRSAVKSARA